MHTERDGGLLNICMSILPVRQKIIREIQLRLGGGMIDIELDPEHYDLAIEMALDRYRQRSQNAMEESFLFVTIQPDVATYTLPAEVQEVRDVYRRNIGATSGGGASIDPFSLAFTNNLYLLSNPGGLGGGGSGMLAQYEIAMGYQELVGRMFGRDVQFSWNTATKKITFHRRFQANEEIALHIYNTKPEEVLYADPYARPWLRDYGVAQCKMMLGEAYSKFQSGLAGPQGGIQLKGDSLKTEGQAELERLENEINQLLDGHEGYGFIIG
jgi:hypothetical protein